MEIPKAAMRATNNAIRGYIPHSGVVSAGAKIMARQQSKEKKAGKQQEEKAGTADRDKQGKRETCALPECNGQSGSKEIV